MRIVFMGTPDFAVPCLQAVLDAGHEVCGVYTKPDKPKGRGYALTPPPVKNLALQHGLAVYQPQTLRAPEIQQQLASLALACIVVVAYGKILPKEVLDMPRYGCINVHGSLLPKYRGAAPIQWSVLNGDTFTGVTTMYMAEGIDTGDVILKEQTEIGPDETSGELYDRLSRLGAKLLVKTLAAVERGEAPRIPQPEDGASHVGMLSKELCPVDWSRTAQEIHNQVRGLSPWPVAVTTLQGKRLKLHRTRLAPNRGGAPGQAVVENNRLFVCCGGGTMLELCRVQSEGKKQMDASDFLRGHPMETGAYLGGEN